MASGISLGLPLADAHRGTKSGHKAANLSKLIAADFDVPPGFVISADACRSHIFAAGRLGAAAAGDADAETREQIRAAILGRDIAGDVWSAVAQAYAQLALICGVPEPRVAVRPSALQDYRGAYESYLNVAGLDELKTAVRRVWASMWNGRAAAFRARLGASTEPAMAVIVQRMVDRTLSGSATTANPITGDPNRVLVSCESGSGECEHFEIDLREMQCGDPRLTTHDPRPMIVAERAVLIEDVFRSRVEIEWAHDADRLWILQAQPLTDLPPCFPVGDPGVGGVSDPDAGLEWRRLGSHPVSPFSRSLLWTGEQRPCAFPERRGKESRRLINGYAYRHRAGIDEADDRKDAARVQTREIALGLKLLEKRRGELLPDLRERSTAIIGSDLAGMDRPALLSALSTVAGLSMRAVDLVDQTWYPSARFPKLLRDFLGSGTDAECLYQRLISGVPTPAITRDAALQDLADRFAAAKASGRLDDGTWWRGFKRDVDDFAREYGYAFADAGEAYDPASWTSWVEDHDQPLRIIGALARRGGGPSLVTLHSARERSSRQAEEEAGEMYEGRAGAHFRNLLALSRGWLAMRAEAGQVAALAHTALRLVLNELATSLCRCGLLPSAQCIFFLRMEEIIDLAVRPAEALRGELAATLARRKHELWLETRLAAPRVLPSSVFSVFCGNGSETGSAYAHDSKFPQHTAEACDLIRGQGVSPGVVTGRACVARSVAEAAEIERGEILVVRSSSLVWTAFFGVAAGFVSEEDDGGSIAPMALDYGIPALGGCAGIMCALHAGARITIDGSAGVVELTGRSQLPQHTHSRKKLVKLLGTTP